MEKESSAKWKAVHLLVFVGIVGILIPFSFGLSGLPSSIPEFLGYLFPAAIGGIFWSLSVNKIAEDQEKEFFVSLKGGVVLWLICLLLGWLVALTRR